MRRGRISSKGEGGAKECPGKKRFLKGSLRWKKNFPGSETPWRGQARVNRGGVVARV